MPFRSSVSWLFNQDTTIAWVVFGLVACSMTGAMLYSRDRRRHGQGPSRVSEANRVEFGYVAALAGMVVCLEISSFSANVNDYPDPPMPADRVMVTGYQWCWRFQYEGTSRTQTGQCQGLSGLPVLVVPAGEPVRLDVTSTDVIQAEWVPQWKFKLYTYPGHIQSLTVTIPRSGRWIGRCAQLCGVYHYEMDFWLRAVPPAQFTTFMRTGRL